jgi:hypothetical protein
MKNPARELPCLLLVVLAGCHAPGQVTTQACAARPPASSRSFQASMATELFGTYELNTVHTSQGGASYTIAGRLVLMPPDTLRRYYRPRLQSWVRTGDRPVAGVYIPADSGYPDDIVEVEGEVLYVGCRMCMDASPNHYQITWVLDSAFGGTWENFQTGIWRVYDSASGRELPNPAGYFCARRLSSDSAGPLPT